MTRSIASLTPPAGAKFWHRLPLVATALVSVAVPVIGFAAAPPPRTPSYDARRHQTRYSGPEDPPTPADRVEDVRIGYFGPTQRDGAKPTLAWQAALAAVRAANREGGWHGKPFRLLPAWSDNPWGTGVKELTDLVYRQKVWAIIGGIGGPSTHLAEQVAAKARLPLVSPVATDKTVNMANVPWMFSLAPNDAPIATTMATHMRPYSGALVMVTAKDHDSHVAGIELSKALRQLQCGLARHLDFDPTSQDFKPLVAACTTPPPAAIVVFARFTPLARLVSGLRAAHYAGPLYAGPAASRPAFRQRVGPAVNGLVFPWLIDTRWMTRSAARLQMADAHDPFATAGDPPAAADYTAVLTYDATQLVIAAVRRGGLSRTAIARQLRQLSPYQGVSGPITWDGLGSNQRPPHLATWRGAHCVPVQP